MVSWHVFGMFDKWYPDMFWHVWCKRMLLVVRCYAFCHVCSNTSDRRCNALCFVLFAHTLLTGGLLTCFGRFEFLKKLQALHCHVLACFGMFVSARWYTDMFWHACSPACLCIAFANTCDRCFTEEQAGHHKSTQNSRKQVWRVCTFWNACFTR